MYQPSALRSTYLISKKSRVAVHHSVFSKSARYTPYLPAPFTRPPPPSSLVIQSSSGGVIPIVAILTVVLSGTIVIYQKYKSAEEQERAEEGVAKIKTEEQLAVMTGAPLPGRPGNLTAEQEVKLKEFWVAVLHVFGVPDLANGDETSEPSIDTRKARADTLSVDKKSKKKRVGFLGKKNHDDSGTDGAESVSSIDGDDKYGQIKDFHRILENQSPEQLRKAFWSMVKHDDPDGLLLRFLRARKWNIQNALVMLIATMQWRMQEMKVDDDIVRRGEGGAAEDEGVSNAAVKKEGHDFLQQMRMGKSFLHGSDKEGRPMCFVRVRLHKQGEQTEASLERYTVYTIETARLLLGGNVDTAAIIFDMTDFSMANMDYGPVKFMIKCFEANYPESLGVVLVHKSPWIFHSIWKIIKGWLDPVVAGKVHFTKTIDDLSEFIPLDHITQELGGKDPWMYKFMPPVAGENAKMEDHMTRDRLIEERTIVVKDYESTTQQWLHGMGNDVIRRRQALAEKLRSGYWELDPYVRARTYYDRTGMINPGGNIQFYAPPVGAKSVANGRPIPAGHIDDDVD